MRATSSSLNLGRIIGYKTTFVNTIGQIPNPIWRCIQGVFYHKGLAKLDETLDIMSSKLHSKMTMTKKAAKLVSVPTLTNEELENLEASSSQLAKLYQDDIASAITSIQPVLPQIQNTFITASNGLKVLNTSTSGFLEMIRGVDKLFLNIADQVQSVNQMVVNAVNPLMTLSETMRQNANAIKTMAMGIENVINATAYTANLQIPTLPIDEILDIKNLENIDTGLDLQREITITKPIAYETRQLQLLTDGGQVYATFVRGEYLDDMEVINKVYLECTGQQHKAIQAPVTKLISAPRRLKINTFEDGTAVIALEGVDVSKPIKVKKSAWFQVFQAYIDNLGILDPSHILTTFNKAKGNRYLNNTDRSEKDAKHIPQINHQIIKGLKQCFPGLAKLVSINLVVNDSYSKGRYVMKVKGVDLLTFVN